MESGTKLNYYDFLNRIIRINIFIMFTTFNITQDSLDYVYPLNNTINYAFMFRFFLHVRPIDFYALIS